MRTTEASVKGRVPVKRLFQGGKADLGLVGQVLARKPAARQFLAHLGADHFILFGGKVVVIHGGRNIPHIPAHFHHRRGGTRRKKDVLHLGEAGISGCI